MATATPTAPDDPIVAIYPIPGEVDEGTDKTPPLAAIPTRLPRADAEKVVKRGAFSYVDESYADREAAAKAARPAAAAASVSPASKADIAAAVKAAMADASKATDDRIAELEAKLAEATKPVDPA